MSLTQDELRRIYARLLSRPPQGEERLQEVKYLQLGLTPEDQAELALLAAQHMEALAGEMEVLDGEGPANPRWQEAQREWAAANEVFNLITLWDEHQLRGQIRFLKHYLENTR